MIYYYIKGDNDNTRNEDDGYTPHPSNIQKNIQLR